jgi:hypothetical protein
MHPDVGGERLEEKDWGIDISVPKIEVLRIRFSGLKKGGIIAGGLGQRTVERKGKTHCTGLAGTMNDISRSQSSKSHMSSVDNER